MIKEIRKYFNSENLLIAGLIGKSLHAVNAMACGKRTLSLNDINILMPFYKALNLRVPDEQIPIVQKRVFNEENVKKELRKLRRRLERRKVELEKLLTAIPVRNRGLYATTLVNEEELDSHAKRLLGYHKRNLSSLWGELSEDREFLLKADIAATEVHMKLLEERLEEESKED